MKKRALISVFDKEGILDFAKFLVSKDVEIVSTGGTYRYLKENGLDVIEINEVTNFPEMLDGRVKTLHPLVHAGILAIRDNEKHMNTLKEREIHTIDYVVVNLYPFFEKVKENLSFEEKIEFIDIGGPTMLRSAAKSFKDVVVISDVKDYDLIKEEINKIENSRKLLKNDTEIKNAMTGSDLRISIGNLEKEIRDLEARMEGFQISEGYNEIKADIEKCTRDKNDLINQIAKYENIIKSINKNLELKVDVTAEKVKNLYEEANVIFPENMLKSMQEICDFHEKLLDGRKARLIKDKKQYQSEIRKIKKNLARLDQIINNDMEFIKDKVSTTEYERLQSRLTELKVTLAKMQQYDTVIKQLEIKKANYQADLAKDNIEAIAYINAIEEYKKGLDNQFSQFVDYIYGERKYSGIDIVNNPGDNKQRFDINVEIQDDGSGGIGNVKIFCMDMLIWDKGKNNKVQFLYHDGSLFAETDPRQCYRMLKIANDICEKGEKQYIINLNYDMFDNIISVAKELDDEAFANTLNNSIRLKLYDRSPEDKLLGIQIK